MNLIEMVSNRKKELIEGYNQTQQQLKDLEIKLNQFEGAIIEFELLEKKISTLKEEEVEMT